MRNTLALYVLESQSYTQNERKCIFFPCSCNLTLINKHVLPDFRLTFTAARCETLLYGFSLCHWNVNSLLAHTKISLLAAYNSIYRYDIIYISESFFDSTISDDDNILHMEGYNLIRADHPNNTKGGGVWLYFKKGLALRKIELSHVTECLLSEVDVKGQVGVIAVSYCSPSQTSSQFDDILSNFEKFIDDVQTFQLVNYRAKIYWNKQTGTCPALPSQPYKHCC